MSDATGGGYDIAVIGMAGRFPGARNVAEFWHNLRNGVESIKTFTDDELLAAGESPDALRDPSYVKAQPVLADFDQFDAGLFGFSPQDAAIMDPQHRVFLEVGWEALENAGYTSQTFPGSIGVFATCGMNTYMMYHLVTNPRLMETVGEWLIRHTGNDMSFLATRLSYVLNLSGPSMNVQTACSSAMVAIHLACQSLLSGECDMALAGGSTVVLPSNRGYFHKQGEILSPDGHCRAFDANARGTLFGSGAGVVALRRLDDAQARGDQILAVIKGSAVNNDGSSKVGYLAPGVEGQAKVITEALTVSGVDPESISYVEMHGTGTIVGDPIEVTALTQAWRRFTDKRGICRIGSLKTNIGHLGEAAGTAAFIKAVLSLSHREIPPSLHYQSPNPQIDFASSPFFVNTELVGWPSSQLPRRAAVTSLGAGGTNCHMIIEEAPKQVASGPSRPQQLLLLSARTPTALAACAKNLADHLRAQPEANLADVAYTLHTGRKLLAHRRAILCRDSTEAIAALEAQNETPAATGDVADRPIAFLFPGQGSQYPNMGRGLYHSEPVFRKEVDHCAEILKRANGLDLLPFIYSDKAADDARRELNQTRIAQPALFVIEYALAKLWMSWGVEPRAMIGHSLGEYVAACLAGVFSLADALSLVADRGALMQQAAPGSMLAVALPAAEIEQALARSSVAAQLSLAAVNAPAFSVIAGPHDAVASFEAELARDGIQGQRLETSHAFHSAMMEPVLDAFAERVRRTSLNAPSIPYLSNLTGNWIRPEEATDANYWARHIRSTVRFSEGVALLLAETNPVLLEVGPGRVLGGLARQQSTKPALLLQSLGRFGEDGADAMLFKSYGQLWASGCKLDPARFYAGQKRRRVSLPSYPFEHKRYWVEAGSPIRNADSSAPGMAEPAVSVPSGSHRKQDIAQWFSLPGWEKALRRSPSPAPATANQNWLVFLDEAGLGSALVERLRQQEIDEADPQSTRLEVVAAGDVDSIALVPSDRRGPGPGEIEIRVRSAALNFADVLKATGVFPEAPFGMECAGIIERLGPGVTEFRVGDDVVAIGPESFRSHVVRDARLVAHKPDFLSFDEAVTFPAAFMTAWYALNDVGKLHAGESVLIHAASGGVGLAAIQVARSLGAKIFATAGNDEKRAYLKSLGIRHVFDSRALGFAEEILRLTQGKGVNVVLNSLTGEFIPKSFAVLAAGGRFLEIGKREIYTAAQISALPLQLNITYHPIDLTRLLRDDPAAYGALLHEIVGQAQARRFEPLTRKVYRFPEAARAFHLMLQTRHIGKVVLSFDRLPPEVFCVRAGRKFKRVGAREFTIRPGRYDDYVALLEALEADEAKIGRIAHFWNVAPLTSASRPLDQKLERSFFSLAWLGKALGSRDWTQPIELSVVSTGLYQIAGETRLEPLKATLLGPCRVLPRELLNLTCRSVDIPVTDAHGWQRARVTDQLAAELTTRAPERSVAYRGDDRWVERYEPARFDASGAKRPLRQNGVCLITGGLGGLGLEIAEDFARSASAKLILVGRSSLPRRNEWDAWLGTHHAQDPTSRKIHKIRACEAHGGEVLVASADVADVKQMRAVVAEARKRFGAIHGVVHAAGSLDDGLIQLKTAESALSVLAPKVTGALVLDEVLGDTPLDFFVQFSSISSILGLQGQVDYSAANAFQDAFAEFRAARGLGRSVAINWSAWQDVGMAARNAGPPRSPVAGEVDKRPDHPWLERRREQGEEIVFTTEFSRARQWVLGEHVLRDGDALIPGTGYLELARAAFREVVEAQAVEISRVYFLTPFTVRDGETKELEIALQRTDSGWEWNVRSEAGSVTHVTGQLAAGVAPPSSAPNISDISRRCDKQVEQLSGFLDQSFMNFGPRWGNVREIRYGRGEALLSLELPEAFAGDLGQIQLHPALLDMATGGAQRLLKGAEAGEVTDFYVPFSYGRLILRKGFPSKLHSHVRRREDASQDVATFDVTVTDDHGAVLAEISDFVMKKVTDRSALMSRPASSPAASAPALMTLAQDMLRQGIPPKDGVEAFRRILVSGASARVVVSPVDPSALMRRVDAETASMRALEVKQNQALDDGTMAARSMASDPSGGGAMEKRLAAMFCHILGVASVSPGDDFFELGGHSLLAVRLLARIEKEFGKNVPLPVLFERPTIAGLASYLHGGEVPKQERPDAIVPLNEEGNGVAFYCVHSVGGEVMSFRHLARLLGREHRFYGIQAPPDLRNGEFPSSVEAMAQYYVDALIAFQPDGPYLLGGWSAGSIIALEMAQQLEASGRKVALLVALDGAPFNTGAGTSPFNPLYYWKLLRNLPLWIADDLMVDFALGSFARRVQNKLFSLSRKAGSTLRGEGDRHGHEVDGFMDTSYYSDGQLAFMRALYSAIKKYVPKDRYSGRVLVYAAQTQPLYHLLDVEAVWAKLVSRLEVVSVRGTHESIVKERHVGALADHLRARIAEFQQEPAGDDRVTIESRAINDMAEVE